jgi:kynurenine formamidase
METDGARGNWGRWGPADERGALNLATPEVVLGAAGALRTGKVYSLAIPISPSRTPAVFDRMVPERLTRTAPPDTPATDPLDSRRDDGLPRAGASDDVLMFSSHTGTHLDALCHVFEGDAFYNGHPVESFSTRRGATKCSIERTGTFATRAVLLDVQALLASEGTIGPTDPVAAGYTITASDLQRCCDRQQVGLTAGSAALIHTGWLELLKADRSTPGYPQAGIGLDAAAFLQSHDVAVVGADNSAVEVLPFDGGRHLAVHVELLVHSGIGLLEHLWLADLAADACYESLLVVGALPVTGATGSPVNPVAIG